jgi:manganese/zinc/iron transport system substrate-binding protein
MKNFFLFILGIVAGSLLYFHYKHKDSPSKNKKPLIVCTTSIIADSVSRIVQNYADVIAIMGPDIDPHLYKASSGDIYKINNAKIIFYNGLHLEGKMGEIFSAMHQNGKNIFAVTAEIPKSSLLQTEYMDIYDPHVWHDIILWKDVIRYITKKICEIMPEHKDIFIKNNAQYQEELDNLHHYVTDQIGKIKYAKILITSHDAFSYFAKRYGIQFYSIQGISTDSEPSIQDNEKILKIILDHQVKTIFVEQTVAENYLKNIQKILCLKNTPINLAKHKLYSDALGHTSGNTYIKMIKENVIAMVEGMNNYE